MLDSIVNVVWEVGVIRDEGLVPGDVDRVPVVLVSLQIPMSSWHYAHRTTIGSHEE